ncbi:hypothetical protein [Stygiobacter electus]|uniref:DUF5683 domain-containing protein n=1 Tax=Stygiobacter electus TaxID=3032292 RepID=A0AAE3NYB6_9BACT|nr:hypothetical protein [Stygiobacter electus]MDF1610835.1 hypothetical protein [Stygiobacter electus]
MKNIILFIVFFSSILTAQTINDLKFQDNNSLIQNFNSNFLQLENSNNTQKNAGLAIIYSLLLPGMGELYAGNFESGKYFTIADGVLWGTYAGFNIYGNNKKENYIAYAKANAGINLEGKESDFIANVGIYISSSEYNRIQELNRNFDKTYNLPNQQWIWQSNDMRKEFRNLWSSSESAFNNLRFVAGALVLNRIISAINAVRLVSAYNKNLSQELSWNIYFNVENRPTLPQTISFNFISIF